MNTLRIFALTLLCLSTNAYAELRFTRQELELKSKDELIGIILGLQGGGASNCQEFSPENGAAGNILVRLNHPGWGDDGTLKYPNGNIFMLRHSGWGDDGTFYYPNGQVMIVKHAGWGDHMSMMWPNGKVMRLRHNGWGDDGSIFRNDGSTWLLRHSGWGDDRQRFGLPVDTLNSAEFAVSARLTSDDSVLSTTKLSGTGWVLEIRVDGSSDTVSIRECF